MLHFLDQGQGQFLSTHGKLPPNLGYLTRSRGLPASLFTENIAALVTRAFKTSAKFLQIDTESTRGISQVGRGNPVRAAFVFLELLKA